jgi:membrane dipeptidase
MFKMTLLPILFLLFLPLFADPDLLSREETLEQKAARIHDEVLTLDTHVDTPLRLDQPDFDLGARGDARGRGGKLDLPRMKEGGLDAVFFAVFLGQGERTPEGNEKAGNRAFEIFDEIYKAVESHSDLAGIALAPRDAYALEKQGKRAVYIGMENGYPLGSDLSRVQKFYDRGARYITLCHTKNNDICDSSTDEPEHHGLSDFGRRVVEEMNRLGVIVDVSHASDEAFYDVLEVSKAPVMASHSCARALCDNPRNLDDAMLEALAKMGGVIQMCILSEYVEPSPPDPERDAAVKALRATYGDWSRLSPEEKDRVRAEWDALNEKHPRFLSTVARAVDHIDHIVEVAGIDHVGIGTDFDGGGGLKDCYDVSEMGNITLELVRRGYTRDQIEKIWGGNFMRVFREVVDAAGKIQAAVPKAGAASGKDGG